RSTSPRMSDGICPPVLRLCRAVLAAGSYTASQMSCRRTANGLLGVVVVLSVAAQVYEPLMKPDFERCSQASTFSLLVVSIRPLPLPLPLLHAAVAATLGMFVEALL